MTLTANTATYIDIDSAGYIYISNFIQSEIYKFTSNGTLVSSEYSSSLG
jgi:hypothetical protein